jgi:3-dehydroquinate dehydratase type I
MIGPDAELWERQGAAVCGCLVDCTVEDFPAYFNYPGIDILEWRIDAFYRRFPEDFPGSFFKALSCTPRHPVIATNRPSREMGAFEGPEDLRLQILSEAARAGADWIDLEHDAAREGIAGFRMHDTKILVSWHNPSETPSRQVLRSRLEKMCKTEADALKIVTKAQTDEDNLRVLELIPLARREFDIDLIAFCMGPIGKWSRLVSVLLGSPWTYAQIPGQEVTAPGQLTVAQVRDVLRIMDLRPASFDNGIPV